MHQFTIGINKCRDAIARCVGDPATIRLSLIGDLTHFKKLNERVIRPQTKQLAPRRHQVHVKPEPVKPVANELTIIKLLQVGNTT